MCVCVCKVADRKERKKNWWGHLQSGKGGEEGEGEGKRKKGLACSVRSNSKKGFQARRGYAFDWGHLRPIMFLSQKTTLKKSKLFKKIVV